MPHYSTVFLIVFSNIMQFTEADRQLIPYSDEVRALLDRIPKGSLLEIVKGWFKIRQLCPKHQPTTWADYKAIENRRKNLLIDRITSDWPDGLSAFQIAQIDLECHATLKKKRKWVLWELVPDPRNPELFDPSRDSSAVCRGIQDELSHYYKCHVATTPHESISADWIRIAVYESRHTNAYPPNRNIKYIIRYPSTPYIILDTKAVMPSMGWKQVFQRVLTAAFGAGSIKEHNLSGWEVDELSKLVLNRNMLGAFSELLLNQFDANPLDYHQITKKRPLETPYVQTRDQRRRIVPLDRHELQARSRGIKNYLGLNMLSGIEDLTINIQTPLNCMKDKVPENMHAQLKVDRPVTMKLTLKGNNVMEGLRDLMMSDILVQPIPAWYGEIASKGINKVWITKEGVMREELDNENDGSSDNGGDHDDDLLTGATMERDPDDQGISKIL
ncbi:kinetochore protein CHL4 like-domain-containing protein [Dichotomocladium elegans]|nr:kinetochore protein CHL4 like-domain-containing protein [Dichotomocladium elegans]